MRTLSITLLAVLLAAAPGCKKKDDGKPAATTTGSGSAVVAGSGSAIVAGSGSAIATGSAIAAGSGSGTETGSGSAAAVGDAIAAALAATDRTDADRALDAGRKPGELFEFIGLAPGMRVAEVVAGGGYTSELLARVVGPTGKVYAQNPMAVVEFAGKSLGERLDRLKLPQLVRLDGDHFSAEMTDLDLVVSHLVYHDGLGFGADRSGMNGEVWKALKPGGLYVVVDHAAKDDADPAEAAKTLHRITKKFVVDEVEQTGFKLNREGTFLQHADDTRDWNADPGSAGAKRGTSDRFVLVFKKPAA